MDYSNLNAETVKPGWERLVYGNFLWEKAKPCAKP